MLYVDVEINGHPVKAFVDSGAQSTIMSAMCAERCGLMRLLDKRFQGEARGVGTAKILGRVHIVQMKFGKSFFPVSLTILEKSDVDFLFGLDMLKRHRCEISLKSNELLIESVGGVERVAFLSEKDIPRADRWEEFEAAGDRASASSSGGGERVGDSVGSSAGAGAGAGADADEGIGLDPEKLATLQALGFSESKCRQALTQTGGDAELAATLLMSE
jgi:DNA damage-inducible protein 1